MRNPFPFTFHFPLWYLTYFFLLCVAIINIYTAMYDWSIKKNQYWVFAAQERDCALPDSNQEARKKKKKAQVV